MRSAWPLARPLAGPTARRFVPAGSVVCLAFAARMITLLTHGSGGLGGVYGYDAGVYYAASDSLLQGNMPYRDYVLLHPPGLPLALTPFAALGRLTSDHTGYVVANLAFVLLACANAGLVYGVARRLGAGQRAAWLGGAFYAVWYSAILAETSLRLEPLAAFAALLGVFVLARPGRTARAAFAGGALVAFAACVKIWWAVPVVAVGVVLVVGRRHVRAYLLGTAATVAVVVLPFFAAAPGAMWRMVVRDQLRRPAGGATGRLRLDDVTTLSTAHVSRAGSGVGLVLAALLLAVLVVRAARTRPGQAVAAVFVLQAATLLLSPTYFSFYGGYVAPACGLLVAMSAAAPRAARVRAHLPAAMAVVAVAALTIVSIALSRPISVPFPRAQLTRAVAGARCVGTDSPIALVELDVLTRDLRDRCLLWVDVTGRTYDADATAHVVSRQRNRRWQADILQYLARNDVALVIRPGTDLSAATSRTIRSWPVVRRVDGITVRAVPATRRTSVSRRSARGSADRSTGASGRRRAGTSHSRP